MRVGCLEDRGTRILREKATYLNVNSPWHCQKFCGEYKYFGLEVSAQHTSYTIKGLMAI